MTLQSESVVLLRTGVPPEPHLRSAWGGITLKIAKKTLPIREVKEVREVRDDKAACPLIQLSQDKESGFRLRRTEAELAARLPGDADRDSA